MTDSRPATARFGGLVDLASAPLGGKPLLCSDDFFASMHNLLKPEPAVFLPGEFTERGKWMDGWESRRKRYEGHDWCVLELGCPGQVRAFDIDTSHFLGNHPPYASVEGLRAARGTAAEALPAEAWFELLPQSPLLPGSQNLFVAAPHTHVSHLRLNIYPDGGVARLRAYGHVEADWTRATPDPETLAQVEPNEQATGWMDLLAMTSGGATLACSDAFFGPTHNLILPGRADNMGGGWETRRKRSPGHDWVLFKLGARGVARLLEIDTNHFKGNAPGRCALDLLDAGSDVRITDLVASDDWRCAMPEVAVQPHTRNFFGEELAALGAATHARLHIFPDGGISRVRLWGSRD